MVRTARDVTIWVFLIEGCVWLDTAKTSLQTVCMIAMPGVYRPGCASDRSQTWSRPCQRQKQSAPQCFGKHIESLKPVVGRLEGILVGFIITRALNTPGRDVGGQRHASYDDGRHD